MRDATRVTRAGLPEPAQGAPFLPGPTFAAPYHLSGDPSQQRYGYGRDANPTWTLLEDALGELEGGEAVVFGSGMAAISAVMLTTLRPGTVVAVPADGYYRTRTLARDLLAGFGVGVRELPTGAPAGDDLAGASLLWLETPSNPGLEVCDIAELAGRAHAAGVLVAVDNTTATPIGQRPLELGADLSVASDTKALSGHSDLVLGHAAARDPKRAARLRRARGQLGAIAGPMEAWLAHRSLATLHVRLQRQCRNALAIAELLAGHPRALGVRYPGLPGDPSHALACRQMRLFGPVVRFDLGSQGAAERFLDAADLIYEATSFGGVHTTAERRARWAGDAVPEGFIRLSAGLEDTDDLLEDLERALGTLSAG
jgi:cystathionine gamma-lyase